MGILREHYGRGPMKAKTYALDDIIVVVMRGSGFTALEQTIMDSGEPDRVIAMREDFQRVMATRYKETIEELTERKVLAFLSQAHVAPDITMEIFFVDRPLDGFPMQRIRCPIDRQDDCSRVVDIRVVRIGVLKCPAAGPDARPSIGPVADRVRRRQTQSQEQPER